MKKFALLFSMLLLGATFLAAHEGDYVVTKDGTFFFKKLHYGINFCLIGQSSEGEELKFQKSDIISYSKKGELFEKRPVYKNNELTGEEDFMKVVCVRNGLKLFKYEYLSKNTNTMSRRYYVFKGDKFIVEMNDANKPTLTAFFTRS
jgi:hypothetical protein